MVTKSGYVKGLNTSAFKVGSKLYLDSTNGSLYAMPPKIKLERKKHDFGAYRNFAKNQSTIEIICPFCKQETELFIWGLNEGQNCSNFECNATHYRKGVSILRTQPTEKTAASLFAHIFSNNNNKCDFCNIYQNQKTFNKLFVPGKTRVMLKDTPGVFFIITEIQDGHCIKRLFIKVKGRTNETFKRSFITNFSNR